MLKIRVRGIHLPCFKQRKKHHNPLANTPASIEQPDTEKLLGQYLLSFYIFLIVLFSLMAIVSTYAQTAVSIKGKITDEQGEPLPGALIKVKGTALATSSGKDGVFSFQNIPPRAVLVISFIGYQTLEISLGQEQTFLPVSLSPDNTQLSEVQIVSTGYQQLPKERAAGSFVKIDEDLLNRSVSTNITDRLSGITSGLYFNGTGQERRLTYSGSVLGLNIRGQSTLSSDVSRDPLVVLDNFPYEGNLNNLNPNDIENITVLKDAAAASIWGARSGNGVIVITTRKGRKDQEPLIRFNSSLTSVSKPDIFASGKFIDASTYIDIEKYLFDQKYFNNLINNTAARPPLSPVVEILAGSLPADEKEAQINALRGLDYRYDYSRYFYQRSLNQQYSLSISGGGSNMAYSASFGLDKNSDNLVNNGYDRFTLNARNTYTPFKNLDITAAINYSSGKTLRNNQLGYGLINIGGTGGAWGNLWPYAQLADENGKALPVTKDYRLGYVENAAALGFLNWQYRPLDEVYDADAYDKTADLLARVSLDYTFCRYLKASLHYQNETQNLQTWDYYSTRTYYARNLINRFSQYNAATRSFTYPFPNGGILNLGSNVWVSQNGRAQLSFDRNFSQRHEVNAIAGAEIREVTTEAYNRNSYGYDDEYGTSAGNVNYDVSYPVNPGGSGKITAPDGSLRRQTYRYLSYYANAGYTLDGKYTLTLSARKDGSNIFGAKTNDKMTPLWSAGAAWQLSREGFYSFDAVPLLRLRASFGYNGNVYHGSAYAAGGYSVSPLTGMQIISNISAPNPELRWEKVKNVNLGIDFAIRGDRVSGTIEPWIKEGRDLINSIPLASSTGFLSFNGNSARTSTKGLDIQLNTQNLKGAFSWNSVFLVNYIRDKVKEYNVTQTNTSFRTAGGAALVDYPLYAIFSYRWAGLDPSNGDPQGYVNGKVSKDYTAIINNFSTDSLVYNGPARPAHFGSVRNDFSFRGLSLSVNITYKLGYWFRRPSTSLNYRDVIALNGYSDVAQRWQQPGDENSTTVPSLVYPNNANRNNFYQYSEVLVENAGHIRLQDIRLGYTLTRDIWPKMPFRSAQLYSYANNIGIIWRKNGYGIDPDAAGSNSSYVMPAPFSIAFGLTLSL